MVAAGGPNLLVRNTSLFPVRWFRVLSHAHPSIPLGEPRWRYKVLCGVAVIGVGSAPRATFSASTDYGLLRRRSATPPPITALTRIRSDGTSRLAHPVLGEILGLSPALNGGRTRSRSHVGNGDHRDIGGDRRRPRRICGAERRYQPIPSGQLSRRPQ
jgi:hypothetical protein